MLPLHRDSHARGGTHHEPFPLDPDLGSSRHDLCCRPRRLRQRRQRLGHDRGGRRTLAGAAVGELGPILAITILLTTDSALRTGMVLAAFLAVIAIATWYAFRGRRSVWLRGLLERTLDTSGQLMVRIVVLFLAFMVWVASELAIDVLLGAFAAGMIFR